MDVISDIDLNGNAVVGMRVEALPSPPASPLEGQSYYDTAMHMERFWNGTEWINKGIPGNPPPNSVAQNSVTATFTRKNDSTNKWLRASEFADSNYSPFVSPFNGHITVGSFGNVNISTFDVKIYVNGVLKSTEGSSLSKRGAFSPNIPVNAGDGISVYISGVGKSSVKHPVVTLVVVEAV